MKEDDQCNRLTTGVYVWTGCDFATGNAYIQNCTDNDCDQSTCGSRLNLVCGKPSASIYEHNYVNTKCGDSIPAITTFPKRSVLIASFNDTNCTSATSQTVRPAELCMPVDNNEDGVLDGSVTYYCDGRQPFRKTCADLACSQSCSINTLNSQCNVGFRSSSITTCGGVPQTYNSSNRLVATITITTMILLSIILIIAKLSELFHLKETDQMQDPLLEA